MATPGGSLKKLFGLCLMVGASLVIAACSSSEASGPITVIAGLNDPQDPTIGVTEYLPESITVDVGTVVTWLIEGPEPHSVTFFPVGMPRARDGAFTFEPIPPDAPFDGTTTISSGLEPREGPVEFTVAFSKAGTYDYFCVIHIGMNGTVEVVESGGESQQEIDSRAATETAMWLDEGRQAKARLVSEGVKSYTVPDGPTEWVIATGIDTSHTTILAFAPDALEVAPGDTITFENKSRAPHTATFLGGEPLPPWYDAPSIPAQPARPDSPLIATEFINSGTLLFPSAGQIGTWSFVATEPGSFTYFCIYHSPSKMVGTITVQG